MSHDASAGKWIFAVLVVVAAVVAWMYLAREPQPTLTPGRDAQQAVASAPVPENKHYPIAAIDAGPAAASTTVLPSLVQSDASVTSDLLDLVAGDSLRSLLVSKAIIPRIVATVDALPRARLAPALLPVRSADGTFQIADTASGSIIADANIARYAPYMHVIESVDMRQAVTWYKNHYPLFQQAYRELGYPDGYFNDRLVVVIDHLLATPTLASPAVLVPGKGVYVYANPQLESLSAGQKLMLRAGPDNQRTITHKLRELRELLTSADAASLRELGAGNGGEPATQRDQPG